MTRTLRQFAKISILAAVSLVATAFVLELLAVVFYDEIFSAYLYRFDDESGYRARSNFAWGEGNVTNAFGWNDIDHPIPRVPGVRRIVLLGDSYSWAGGLAGNYATLLEGEMAKAGLETEVLNVGYAGSHLGEQLVWLRDDALQFDPDLVALAFYVGNDFSDAIAWRRVFPLGGRLRSVDVREVPLWVRGRPFLVGSHLATFVEDSWRRATQTTTGSAPDSLRRSAYLAVERDRMMLASEAHFDSISDKVEYVAGTLSEMRALLERHGIDFIVLALPDPFQIDAQLRQEVIDEFAPDLGANPRWDRPQRVLEDLCRAQEIPFLDLLPAFTAAHRVGHADLYLPNEPHWDDAGNELAARVLAAELTPRLLAGPGPADP